MPCCCSVVMMFPPYDWFLRVYDDNISVLERVPIS
nr:MAG TPA_asm: hypothetical protein [Caudoviricetes sp.]